MSSGGEVMAKFVSGGSSGNSEDSKEWAVPTAKCAICGHEGAEDLVIRPVRDDIPSYPFHSVPVELKQVCAGCSDKYDQACLEAAADVREEETSGNDC